MDQDRTPTHPPSALRDDLCYLNVKLDVSFPERRGGLNTIRAFFFMSFSVYILFHIVRFLFSVVCSEFFCGFRFASFSG